ncbi:hypothetical protein BHM03_00060564, partial [Ensete ventricosum]
GLTPCCEKVGLKKGPWTPEEDQKLLAYIGKHGTGSWRSLPAKAGEPAEVSSAAEVREELQVEVDELPATGHKEGRVQLAGGADHHPTPCPPRKQVIATP